MLRGVVTGMGVKVATLIRNDANEQELGAARPSRNGQERTRCDNL
jgi:hypothetical protein